MRVLRRRAAAAAGSLIFFAAALALPSVTTAVSCSSYDSCGDCRDTSTCHWCPDQQCHALGSPHGCFYGTSCYDNDQCLRQVPEFRGYAAPSIGVLLGVFLVGSTALVCGVAAISVAREYAKESAATREADATTRSLLASAAIRAPAAPTAPRSRPEPVSGETEYMTLVGDEAGVLMSDDPESDPAAQEEEGGEASAIKGKRRVGRAGRVGGAYRGGGGGGRAGRRGGGGGAAAAAAAAAAGSPGPSPLARKVLLFTRVVFGTGMVAAMVMCGVVVWFAPHTPGVNMCNTEFDWKSIVQSLKKASLETDFQLLVSIYNPNVLDAKIESGTAVLYHKHTEVGLMAFEPAVLEGGYVTDLLLTIAFDGEAWEEAHIGLEYETGKLAFLMDATVSASVMWHGLKTYPFTFSVKNYYIKVSSATDYDRSLCNCSQMMQGGREAGGLPALAGGAGEEADGAGEEADGAGEIEAAAVGAEGAVVFPPVTAAAAAADGGTAAVMQ